MNARPSRYLWVVALAVLLASCSERVKAITHVDADGGLADAGAARDAAGFPDTSVDAPLRRDTGPLGGGSSCDEQGDCNACFQCTITGASSGVCNSAGRRCESEPTCEDAGECLLRCLLGDNDCIEACRARHPRGFSPFVALYRCSACRACVHDCEGGEPILCGMLD